MSCMRGHVNLTRFQHTENNQSESSMKAEQIVFCSQSNNTVLIRDNIQLFPDRLISNNLLYIIYY